MIVLGMGWRAQALVACIISDAGCCAFNAYGNSLPLFISQIVIHFAIVAMLVADVSNAWPEVEPKSIKITLAVSILKFASIFLYFVPFNFFQLNFIFYALVIHLSLNSLR